MSEPAYKRRHRHSNSMMWSRWLSGKNGDLIFKEIFHDSVSSNERDQGNFTKTLILMMLDFYREENLFRLNQETKRETLAAAFLRIMHLIYLRRHKRQINEVIEEDNSYFAKKEHDMMERIKKVYHAVMEDVDANPFVLHGLAGEDSDHKNIRVNRILEKLTNGTRTRLK